MKYENKEKLKSILNKVGLLGAMKYCYRFKHYSRHIACKKASKKRASGYIDPKYAELKKYENKHKGERCFIIATGPSLRLEDVERLKNEYTLSMNSIIKLFDKTSWRPTYYGIQDSNVYYKLYNDNKFDEMKDKFIADYVTEEHDIDSGWNIYPLDLLDHLYYKLKKFKTSFSGNAYEIIYDGGSITYSMMQIAVYMGFDEIYLLGCDCDYSGERQHFIDYGLPAENNPENNMLEAYRTAKKYADANGIKIYNATRGGKLEVFERRNFESIDFK